MKNSFIIIKKCYILLILAGLFVTIQSCDDTTTGPTTTFAIIQGGVIEAGTEARVTGALVRSLSFVENTTTDINGNYSFSVELPDTNSSIITLLISKQGFVTDTIPSVVIQNGKVANAPDAILTRVEGSETSGDVSNIVLVSIETSSIFVKGSGANETSDLTFEARDDNGTPIDLQHQVKVCFRITGGPGGGEFVSPDSVLTDSEGRVVTTVNSGTIAGALQAVAEIQGTSIASGPIPIAIHGWLPDINHFSVVPNKLNFAGYNIFNLENTITAFVGDKFSNPVPPGTVVQFQSTGGIIAGSAGTDNLGRASASLISASPQPQGIPINELKRIRPEDLPAYFVEPGFALVTAQTVDENQETIYAETVVLFSGITQITNVNPATFSLPAFASQTFNYTVSDQNANPLLAGTNISASTNNGDVAGGTSITLGDTQSRALTHFSFELTNSAPDSFKVKDAVVTITVTSQNGNRTRSIKGQMLPIL